jgi:hypothetical protein
MVGHCHILKKYGIAISATPNMTSRILFEIKYGKIIRATPQTIGTTNFCRLLYKKKQSPIEPNNNPNRRDDVSIGTVERLTTKLGGRPPQLAMPACRTVFVRNQPTHPSPFTSSRLG